MEQDIFVKISELIDAVDSPDWWTIGITSAITIVNAIFMICLGVKQNKLQKRQTQAQEYEIYKSVYLLIVNIHGELDYFLSSISFGTFEPYYQLDKDSLKRKIERLNQLKNDLANNYVDYELKFSRDLFDKRAYYQILDEMTSILHFVNQAIDMNEVYMNGGSEQIPNIDGDEEKDFARAIAKRFKREGTMLRLFEGFIEYKRKLGNCEDALETIKKKCKIY